MEEDIGDADYADSPLDAITLGVLEARSFLFKYDEDDDEENKENDKKKKNAKLQRSQGHKSKDNSKSEICVSGAHLLILGPDLGHT